MSAGADGNASGPVPWWVPDGWLWSWRTNSDGARWDTAEETREGIRVRVSGAEDDGGALQVRCEDMDVGILLWCPRTLGDVLLFAALAREVYTFARSQVNPTGPRGLVPCSAECARDPGCRCPGVPAPDEEERYELTATGRALIVGGAE